MSRSLHAFSLTNYRNLQLENEFELNNLSIFIGSNGSGKSNTIAAIRFLKDNLMPRSQENGTSFMYAVSQERLGWTNALDFALPKPSSVALQYVFDGEKGKKIKNVLRIHLWVQANNVSITLEAFVGMVDGLSDFSFYAVKAGSGTYEVIVDQDVENVEVENVRTDQLLLLGIDELLENSKYPPESISVYPHRRKVLDAVETWQFYNANHMDLGEIRRSEPRISRQDRYLNEDGTNLPAVFYNLRNDDRYFERQISEAMRMILPKTDMIRHHPVGSQSLSIEWSFEGVDEALILSDLSDGTVRMLCWAVVLLSPKLPALLVIEEPEVGLHPAWMKVLATWIKAAAERTQIIVTTHSPDLLDQFTDRIEDVAVFEPVPADPFHYTINRLDKEALSRWFEQEWELGDLYRMGHPLVGGWPW